MADPNFDELADLAGRLNDELRNLGAMAGKTGDAFENAGKEVAQGLKLAAGSAVDFAEATAKGTKGLSAYTSATAKAIDAVATLSVALVALVPMGRLIKGISGALAKLGFNLSDKAISVGLAGLGVGAMAAAEALKGAQRIVAEATDQIYKSYQGLAQTGAAAGDGMSGLIQNAQQLGLSFEELDEFVRNVGANSQVLARFSGTVFEGRKRVADIGGALESSREQFASLGYNMNDVAKATMGFMRQYAQLTHIQNMSVQEQAAAVKAYVIEQDKLTKLTGASSEQAEQMMERALLEEQFAAKIAQMNREGQGEAAQRLMALVNTFDRMGMAQVASGLRALSTGTLTAADAQALVMTAGEGAQEALEGVMSGGLGLLPAMKLVAKGLDQFLTQVGETTGQLQVNDQNFIKISEQVAARTALQKQAFDKQTTLEQAILEQGAKDKKAKDDMLARQADIIATQIEATRTMQNLISEGIKPAQIATKYFAEKVRDSADFVAEKIFGIPGGAGGFLREAGQKFEQGSGGVKPATPSMAAGATQSARGGTRAPTVPAPAAPAAGGGQAREFTVDDLKKLGLSVKEGDVQRPGAKIDPRLIDLAQKIQRLLGPNFAYFSGFADLYHQEESPGSAHNNGLALDFVLKQPPGKEMSKTIIDILKESGASVVRDEYANPGSKATGGHFHVEIPAMAKGGVTEGISIAGEAGPEAVVPLPDGKTIPVRLENDPQTDALNKALRTFAELISMSKLMEVRSTDATTVISPDLAANQAMARIMNKIWPEIRKGFESGKLTIDQFHRMFGPVDPEEQARLAAEATQKYTYDSFAKGGITSGPSIAGEAGPEAVVPLPDGKTIPVRIEGGLELDQKSSHEPMPASISELKEIAFEKIIQETVQGYLQATGSGPIALKDALARPESMPGLTEYGGYNMGPMRTDLEVVAKIAEKLGAYDAATQTITDPATWKQVLFEGMNLSSNMSLGGMNVGSQTFGPEIGDMLADAVKETMEQDRVDLKTALREVGKEWSDAMRMSMDAMSRAGEDPVAQAEIIAELRAISREQARTADASQRIAAAAAN